MIRSWWSAILSMRERSSSEISVFSYFNVFVICWAGIDKDSIISACLILKCWRMGRFNIKEMVTMKMSNKPSFKYFFLNRMKKKMVEAMIAIKALLRKRQIAIPLIVISID